MSPSSRPPLSRRGTLSGRHARLETAEDILKFRLARGDFSGEEYALLRRRVLGLPDRNQKNVI